MSRLWIQGEGQLSWPPLCNTAPRMKVGNITLYLRFADDSTIWRVNSYPRGMTCMFVATLNPMSWYVLHNMISNDFQHVWHFHIYTNMDVFERGSGKRMTICCSNSELCLPPKPLGLKFCGHLSRKRLDIPDWYLLPLWNVWLNTEIEIYMVGR